MPHRAAKQITTLLRAPHDGGVVIIPHQNPDGDALGAATALADWLEHEHIPYTIFCATSIPKTLTFLPHADEVTSDPAVWNQKKFSVIVDVDSGDLEYAGVAKYISALNYEHTIINIDHHPTNKQYGDINLVIPTASSTTEILYRFFTLERIPITSNMATSLMTGLMTDTGTFSNSGTSKLSLSVGSELIKKGADVGTIKRTVLTDKSITTLRLWGTLLSRLTLEPETNVVYTYVLQKDLAAHGLTDDDGDGLANLLNLLNEGKAALVLKERPDKTVKGSFRTTLDTVNVSAWAKAMGGGGHIKAAGFSISGPIEAAIEQVFAVIKSIEKTNT